MSKDISVNVSVFKGNIANLQTSMRGVDCQIDTNESLEKTNLAPFTDNLEALVQLLTILDNYKMLFEKDVQILDQIGEDIQEQDEKLATSNHHYSGHEPVQA